MSRMFAEENARKRKRQRGNEIDDAEPSSVEEA